MTYCVALNLADGLVLVSDTRTNAGIDHIATFRKLYAFGIPGERVIYLQTAGNLATSQSVINLLRHRLHGDGDHLYNAPSMFAVATLVSNTVREVLARDNCPPCGGIDLSCSILVSGQIAGEAPQLYNIYPQTNFISATEDTPYLQIGESKYGKPVLDRALQWDTPLEQALRCALISFDSTIRSNLSVGMPLDVQIYQRDSLVMSQGYRVLDNDAYFSAIREQWGEGLRQTLSQLPVVPDSYWA